jgi:hypothetical protein
MMVKAAQGGKTKLNAKVSKPTYLLALTNIL